MVPEEALVDTVLRCLARPGAMIYAHLFLSLVTIAAVFAMLIKIRLKNYSFPPTKNPVFFPPIDPIDVPCTEKNKDLISRLPDDILVSIISRLSTRDAIRTSLLSRSWRNLYRYVPKIELHYFDLLYDEDEDEDEAIPSELVMDALDSLLRLRSGSKIQSFRLTGCLNKSVTDRFEQCISSLGRLGVEKIFLECSGSWSYILDLPFSCHLFSKMPMLKKLELRYCHLQSSLRSQCNNNSLQKLVLKNVKVSPGAIESILSNCLKLHSLKMTSCKCPSKLSVCGPHLELKSLYINECVGVEEIEFYASNLVVFEVWNRELVNLKFDHIPQLQSTYIHMLKKNILPYVCGKLAMDLPDLKSLNFVTKGDNFQESRINMFGNLMRLYIHVYSLPKTHLLLLASFLHSCPLLQEFHLSIKLCDNGKRVEKQAVVLHSELKKMEIGGFYGTEHEIEFALYILKSAINLEKMHLSMARKIYEGPDYWTWTHVHSWDEETRARIHTKLQGQAISKTAQLSMQDPCPCFGQKWSTSSRSISTKQ